MCGIAGIIDPALSPDEVARTLVRMTDAIIHRGPDTEGHYATVGTGIGMRRLSIIDVASGQQPIWNEEGSICVVLNGEIYNYLQLRRDLDARGHAFRTKSDTEAIVHLYEEYGLDGFRELRGMFAIALWDEGLRRLVLVRDRLGKKPLFYAHKGERFLFGSEIKALLAAEPSLAETNSDVLPSYFRFGFIPEPDTIFTVIKHVPPASHLVCESGRIAIGEYWQLESGEVKADARTAKDWAEELDATLAEAVRIRLMSEVPLGIFLSGGLDSSAIVAYAHRAGLEPLKTFTVGFDREAWDESADAQVIADRFKTDHHVLRLCEQDVIRSLPDTLRTLVRHFDEPFGDASALPTYHVSRLAREHVTVILGGDGGDELFAGYTTYQGIKFAEQYRRLPQCLGRHVIPGLVHWGSRMLPAGWRYAAQRTAKVLHDSARPFDAAYFSKQSLCSTETLNGLLGRDGSSASGDFWAPVVTPDIASVLRSPLPVVTKAGYCDLRFRLLNDMLVKVDRMSMANSLEVRSPFLDHRLVELAARMPPSLKLRGWEKKAILRDVLRPVLPARMLQKRKQGFAVPLRDWLRRGFSEMVGDYLKSGASRLKGSLDTAVIARLLKEHQDGTEDRSPIIWLLLNYAAWNDVYGHS